MHGDNGESAPNGSSLTATQRAVAELWREVLRVEALPGPDDDFFSLGGDSMAMATVEFRIAEELSVQLLPGAILSAPTLRELAIMVEEFGDGNAARRAES